MAIVNGYTTLGLVKANLDITDIREDARLEAAITAASRAIDNACRTRFYTPDATETRYYTAEWPDVLYTGDLVSLTTLQTDEDGDRTYEYTWTTIDYDLEPFNAALDSKPYTKIVVAPLGRYAFPSTRKGVKLTGKFGYCLTGSYPADVGYACQLIAARLNERRKTPLGLTQAGDLQAAVEIAKTDPDVRMLLGPFVRAVVGSTGGSGGA